MSTIPFANLVQYFAQHLHPYLYLQALHLERALSSPVQYRKHLR